MIKKTAPFPDEKKILEFIRENPGRASKREITRAFQIKGEEKIKLKEPNKGKVVSNSEFVTIQQDKAKEMRERYQRGGGGRSSRAIIRN